LLCQNFGGAIRIVCFVHPRIFDPAGERVGSGIILALSLFELLERGLVLRIACSVFAWDFGFRSEAQARPSGRRALWRAPRGGQGEARCGRERE